MEIQLDFFENKTEMDILKDTIQSYKKETDNIRRGFFARYSEFTKLYLKQEERIENLEKMIKEKI